MTADWTFGDGHFCKLYGDRLSQSSLLDCDVATRWVFIYMLSQADAAGRYRCASVAGLARAAVVSPGQARRAVGQLEAPDPDSTTKLEEGRRIVRIPGGWRIVAYQTYLEFRTARQHAEAEKKRRQRERAKAAREKATYEQEQPQARDMSGDVPGTAHQRVEGRGVEGRRVDARELGGEEEDQAADVPPSHQATDRSDDNGTLKGNGKELVTEETAAAIEALADGIVALCPASTRADAIKQASYIGPSNGRAARSFTDPRAKGLGEAWAQTTLSKLEELRQQVLMQQNPPL